MLGFWGKLHPGIKILLILGLVIGSLLALKLADMYYQRTPHIIEFWTPSDETNLEPIDHCQWQTLLDNYLHTHMATNINLFDYGAVSQKHKMLLAEYLDYLTNLDPRSLNRQQQLAYWINLYNAITVNLVIKNYPTDSIRSIGNDIPGFGPWDDKIAKIVRQTLTLNQIEHGILRSNWQDNRIHYAINCASVGCPNLLSQAYTASNLDVQLDIAARVFIKHPRAVRWKADELVLSGIYDWFAEDFGGNEKQILSHLQKYAPLELRSKLQSFQGHINYDYDWQLNDMSADLSNYQ